MCTLTFVKTPQVEILTANRDESPIRRSKGLSRYTNRQGKLFYIAREPLHGGTNLAVGTHHTSVLLNGAFEAHDRKAPYPESRGIVMLESLEYNSLKDFPSPQENQIEPFTLVRIGTEIEILRWDHERLYFESRTKNQNFILASAQLHSREARANRTEWFQDFLESFDGNPDSVFDFHLHGGSGDEENDMVMNRSDRVRTVSVSQVVTSREDIQIRHRDLIEEEEEVKILSLDEIS